MPRCICRHPTPIARTCRKSRAHDRHGGRSCFIGEAEACNFRCCSPISANAVGIGQSGEVIAIEAAGARPPEPLRRFVEVEMMFAEILAGQDPGGMPDSSRANTPGCRGNRC